jgi:acyl-CoA thioesterase-2
MPTLTDLLTVEQIDSDTFRARGFDSRRNRTFGGQVVAQALVAAAGTIDSTTNAHSLHGYFVREGNPREPLLFHVRRLRTGGFFMTRGVDAVQGGTVVFTMTASFHKGNRGPDHQLPMPRVIEPEDTALLPPAPSPRDLEERLDWDLRHVPGADDSSLDAEPPCSPDHLARRARQTVWIRHRHRLPDDPAIHVAGLAYASDMALLGAALRPYSTGELQVASLDHNVWFHRSFRADEWLLYDQQSPSASSGRALSQGHIFDRAGHLVATVAQEGLVRARVTPT